LSSRERADQPRGDEKMMVHPPLSILCVAEHEGLALQPVLAYLQSMAHVRLASRSRWPQDLTPYDVVLAAPSAPQEEYRPLERFVEAGGGWLALAGPLVESLPEIFGVQPGPLCPGSELRVYFNRPDHPFAARLPDPIYVNASHRALETTTEDVEVVLCTDWRYQRNTVLTTRRVGKGRVACATLPPADCRPLQQIFYRLLRYLAGQAEDRGPLGIGLLGYSPSIGLAHGLGVEATPGLNLAAVCDLDARRLDEARRQFPQAKTYQSSSALSGDPHVGVVVVATPPNSHADLAVQMMEAGKHVVCEKPLALNTGQTTSMVETANKQSVHLGCYQNRRWDPDYLAIKQAVDEGLIGDLFYVETFVGGFLHPCGLWHSHEAISGGTAYDWGAHYLDWVVSLISEPVVSVVGTRHKRVWHDTTNADQERIHIRFAGGQEADFLHSDIAAARKPKWYLLGTEGAIVGRWRDVTTYEIDPVHYFQEHEIPATEMVSDLTLYSRHPSGQILIQTLAPPERQLYGFYYNLADHLLTGEPIVAPLEQSVRVVAILEAAARSAASGGTVEAPGG
jgi:predicted dehydrogenase